MCGRSEEAHYCTVASCAQSDLCDSRPRDYSCLPDNIVINYRHSGIWSSHDRNNYNTKTYKSAYAQAVYTLHGTPGIAHQCRPHIPLSTGRLTVRCPPFENNIQNKLMTPRMSRGLPCIQRAHAQFTVDSSSQSTLSFTAAPLPLPLSAAATISCQVSQPTAPTHSSFHFLLGSRFIMCNSVRPGAFAPATFGRAVLLAPPLAALRPAPPGFAFTLLVMAAACVLIAPVPS